MRFLNDAAAYLLGEVGAGAARGVPRAVGITLGTGIGSAFAVNGQIVNRMAAASRPAAKSGIVPYEGGIVEDLDLHPRDSSKSYRKRTGHEREVADNRGGRSTRSSGSRGFCRVRPQLGRALRSLLHDLRPMWSYSAAALRTPRICSCPQRSRT